MAPVEAPAEDAFDEQVVGTCGSAQADAHVDLPLGRDVQVGHQEDLLRLIVQPFPVPQPSVVGVDRLLLLVGQGRPSLGLGGQRGRS